MPRRGVHNYYICACKYVKYMRAIILYVSVPYLKHVRTLSTNNPKVNCNDQKAKVTSRLMSSDETLLLATNPSSKASTFGHLEQHPRNLLPILFFPNISKAPPRIWKKAPQPNFWPIPMFSISLLHFKIQVSSPIPSHGHSSNAWGNHAEHVKTPWAHVSQGPFQNSLISVHSCTHTYVYIYNIIYIYIYVYSNLLLNSLIVWSQINGFHPLLHNCFLLCLMLQ